MNAIRYVTGWVGGDSGGLRDQTSRGLALACMVHCLSSPLLVAFGFTWIGSELLEGLLLAGVVLMAVFVTCQGFARHRSLRLLGLVGLSLLLAGVGYLGFHGWLETGLVVGGNLGLLAAFGFNRYLCRVCPRCSDV